MNWETYLALGDSITIGARTYCGYPELVGETLRVATNKDWNVMNLAVSGFTAIDLSRHLDDRLAGLQTQKVSVTTILIGTNDIKSGISVEQFQISYMQLLVKAKLITQQNNVKLMHIPEFKPGVMYPYKLEMNRSVREYNEMIERVADSEGFDLILPKAREEHFIDGVHLNDDGIIHFAEKVSSSILADRGIVKE